MNAQAPAPESPALVANQSSLLFLGVGVLIIFITLWNWHFDIKPRLLNEAESNSRILAASHARLIETQFQNVSGKADVDVIRNSIDEILSIEDPLTGERFYQGISLEVDYDVFPADFDLTNIEAGNTYCAQCITTNSNIYIHRTGDLAAVLKIYSNPVFYQRLVRDIVMDLAIVLGGIIIVLILAWMTSKRLTRRLSEREDKLVFEIAERKNMEARLQQVAAYDQLTNLPNRYLLQAEFTKKIEETARNKKMLATLFFDLDHFKGVNDMHGHEVGDALLAQVAQRMSSVTRNYDLLARFGGDEFVMIMSSLDNRSDVIQVVEKIIAGFSAPFDLPGVQLQTTSSVGISIYPEDGVDPSELLKNADLAMYRAKAEGRNCYQFFNAEMNLELQYSQWVETNLRRAIRENALQLFFQPQIGLLSGEIESAEALIRWPQGEGEPIKPGDFIKIAERSGLIYDISDWVLNQTCRQICAWRDEGLETVRLDINLSGKDLAERGTLYKVLPTLQRYDLAPSDIGIEIPENILLESSPQLVKALEILHHAGVYISIDDFGTGYSSLSYLKRLPLSGIKIDQSFVHEAPGSKDDLIIMQAITLVAHGFGLGVVAEGVETEWHESLCKGVGCNTIQGNYVSDPLPADAFAPRYLKQVNPRAFEL